MAEILQICLKFCNCNFFMRYLQPAYNELNKNSIYNGKGLSSYR